MSLRNCYLKSYLKVYQLFNAAFQSRDFPVKMPIKLKVIYIVQISNDIALSRGLRKLLSPFQ